MSVPAPAAALLRRRLLQDIAEIQTDPYPGITLHIQDGNLTRACLILSPPGEQSLHLTVKFGPSYPLDAPNISMQSRVVHPNVFDDYICASILNTEEGYTPAYTLKSICIQLLSFFNSDKIEQEHGGSVDRTSYAEYRRLNANLKQIECARCGFGKDDSQAAEPQVASTSAVDRNSHPNSKNILCTIGILPPELLLQVCDLLDDESLAIGARAWNGFKRVMKRYNVVATRQMRCFTLKTGFRDTILGIGVSVNSRKLHSEFDYISKPAFEVLYIRKSVQGLPFRCFLPLPFSPAHWRRVGREVDDDLRAIASDAGIGGSVVQVIYTFMNDVTVRLSEKADELDLTNGMQPQLSYHVQVSSALLSVSEKAIESYFQLVHLLLCLATERDIVVQQARATITAFVEGSRDKQAVPNLGHLVVMNLIAGLSDKMTVSKAIIKEAITRNVVWMLDARGRGMAELSFMETDAVSEYRLQKTFAASKTSYRLLMFGELMGRTVRDMAAKLGPHTSLEQLRDELYRSHGSPEEGLAADLAARVKAIQRVNNMFDFMREMGIAEEDVPPKARMTEFLRFCVKDSMDRGYSKWALTQPQALALRLAQEPRVGRGTGAWSDPNYAARISFFPQDTRGPAGRRRGRR